jgi:hypothetical protein
VSAAFWLPVAAVPSASKRLDQAIKQSAG